MANPQLENGFMQISNEIIEALSKNRIPGEQMQCLFVILRMTYGWNQKKAVIRTRDFVKKTGLKAPNVNRSLKKLLSKNIVIKNDNKSYPTYCFNKNFDRWKTLSKVITKNVNPCEPRADKDVIKSDNKKTLSKVITSVIKSDNKTEIVPSIVNTLNKYTVDQCVFSIYDFYKTEINSLRKSSQRAKKNITHHLKKYSFEDLKKAISNYKSTCGDDPKFRKDPANFFGVNEPFFIDYLPENFEAPKESGNDTWDPWEGVEFTNAAQV